jgi:hypothetical protein
LTEEEQSKMEQPKVPKTDEVGGTKARSVLRKITYAGIALVIFIAVTVVAAIAYNNISLWSDATFAGRLDSAISNAEN